MKLQIDNLDGRGLQDYTSAIESARLPQVTRKLNKPSGLKVGRSLWFRHMGRGLSWAEAMAKVCFQVI
jgi:hypothetical protein